YKDVHCGCDFVHGGHRGRNADIAIFGILAVREGSASGSQLYTRFRRKADDFLGAAGTGVEGHEVTALGCFPATEVGFAEGFLQLAQYRGKTWLEQCCMLGHQRIQCRLIGEKPVVAQLADLVGTNGAGGQHFLDGRKVGRRGAHECDTSAGVGDFRCGSKMKHAVFSAQLLAVLEDVGELRRIITQLMNGVGVVPEHAKIRMSDLAQRGNALHGLVAVHHSGGVGEAGYVPHTANAAVAADQFFYLVHVGASGLHGYGDHVDTQGLGDGEVSIVTGDGANEGDFFLPLPGTIGTVETKEVRSHGGLEHEAQAAVAADQYVFRRNGQQTCTQLFRFGKPIQSAVVAAIGAVGSQVVVVENTVHRVRQRQLLVGRLAAGNIKVEAALL